MDRIAIVQGVSKGRVVVRFLEGGGCIGCTRCRGEGIQVEDERGCRLGDIVLVKTRGLWFWRRYQVVAKINC